jgi:hypothetical protein
MMRGLKHSAGGGGDAYIRHRSTRIPCFEQVCLPLFEETGGSTSRLSRSRMRWSRGATQLQNARENPWELPCALTQVVHQGLVVGLWACVRRREIEHRPGAPRGSLHTSTPRPETQEIRQPSWFAVGLARRPGKTLRRGSLCSRMRVLPPPQSAASGACCGTSLFPGVESGKDGVLGGSSRGR